ncbi:MAG: hypothetical protein HYS18_16860 [Burkholderiales bacterium]|nr:hypothetical protein [Burkholderiales bacterium]
MKRLAVLLAVFLLASCAHGTRTTARSDAGTEASSVGTMGSTTGAGIGTSIEPGGPYGVSGP